MKRADRKKRIGALATLCAIVLVAAGCAMERPPAETAVDVLAELIEEATDDTTSKENEETATQQASETPTEDADDTSEETADVRSFFAGDWIGLTTVWSAAGFDEDGQESKIVDTAFTALMRVAFAQETGDAFCAIEIAPKDKGVFQNVAAEISDEFSWLKLTGSFLDASFESYLFAPEADGPLEFEINLPYEDDRYIYCTAYFRRIGDPWKEYDAPLATDEAREAFLSAMETYQELALNEIAYELQTDALPSARQLVGGVVDASYREALRRATGADGDGSETGGLRTDAGEFYTEPVFESGAKISRHAIDEAYLAAQDYEKLYGKTYEDIRDEYFFGIDATPVSFSETGVVYRYAATCVWFCRGNPEKYLIFEFGANDPADELKYVGFIQSGFAD